VSRDLSLKERVLTFGWKQIQKIIPTEIFFARGKVNNHATGILIDLGCIHNLILEDFAKKANIQTIEAPHS
jgi:hypothetical protein